MVRAVEFAFRNRLGWLSVFLPVEAEDLAGGLEESFRFEEPYMDLMVRYDNGQLCTFRRKSPPQGGEG